MSWGTAAGSAVLEPPMVPVGMTLREAAQFLYPPVTRDQLGRLIAQLPRFTPVSHRPTGGRPEPVYDAADLMDLHNVLRRWLLWRARTMSCTRS